VGLRLAVLLTNAAVIAVGDDEVFYLADSWAARNGETGGMLPMRYLVFRPFLAPGLGPGAAVIGRTHRDLRDGAGRGWARLAHRATAVRGAGRRVGRGRGRPLAGHLGGDGLPPAGVFRVPLRSPRRRVPRGAASPLVAAPGGRVGLAMLTLAAATSHRQAAFPLAGLLVALSQRGSTPPRRTLAWAAGGIALGAAPSVAYVAWRTRWRRSGTGTGRSWSTTSWMPD
jgi:hypothetical protein